MSNFKHSELVHIGEIWLRKNIRLPIVLTEMKCSGSREQPDVLGFNSNCSFMIECKTSLSDFKKDFKKPERMGLLNGVGNYRIYLAPKGIIKPELIPSGWGFLEVDEKGKIDIVNFKEGNIFCGNNAPENYKNEDPFFHYSDMSKERSFLYSKLIRR